MRKLRLDLDSIAVESFATVAPPRDGVGTVHGRESFELVEGCGATGGGGCVEGGGGGGAVSYAPGCPNDTAVAQNTCQTCYWSCGGNTCHCTGAGTNGCPTMMGGLGGCLGTHLC